MVYWILSYANQNRYALYQIEAFVNRRSLAHTHSIDQNYIAKKKNTIFDKFFWKNFSKMKHQVQKSVSQKWKHSTQT